MRFIRLVIDEFAQLDHVELEFRVEKPNLVVGPNEAGKSHLMRALYGMLFGLERPERFRPWSNPDARPRGVLEFETDDGRRVCLERYYEKQEVTVSLDGGEPWTAIVGPQTRVADAEYYFRCMHDWLGFSDSEVFTATTFVRQADLVRANLDGLAPQVKSLMTGTNQADYEHALKTMRKELDGLRTPPGTRNPRLLEQKERELGEIDARLRDAGVRRDTIGGLQERRIEVTRELEAAIERREENEARLERVQALIEREADASRLEGEYREAVVLLNRFVSAHERVEQARIEREKYAAIEHADLVTLFRLEHEVRQAEQHLEAVRQQEAARSGWSSWLPWIAVFMGVAVGIALAYLLHNQFLKVDNHLGPMLFSRLGIAILVVGAIFLLIAWQFGLWKDLPDEEVDAIKQAQSELARVQEERGAAFEELGVSTVEETVTLRNTFEGADRILERAIAGLEALGDEEEAQRRWADIHDRLNLVQREVDDLLEGDVELRILETAENRAEFARGLKDRLDRTDEGIARLQEERAALDRQLLLDDAHAQPIPLLLDARDAASADLCRIRERCDALNLAVDALQHSVEDFQDHMMDPIVEEATELLRALTGGRYTRVRLDHDTLTPSVDIEGKEAIPSSSLGRGVQDQLFFALRVALARALAGGRSLPLVLDDPYVNLDGTRLQLTIDLLQTLAERTQILLFTCNPQYERWFEPVLRLPQENRNPEAEGEKGGAHLHTVP